MAVALAAGASTAPARTLTSQCLNTLGPGLATGSRFCLQQTQVVQWGLQHPQWQLAQIATMGTVSPDMFWTMAGLPRWSLMSLGGTLATRPEGRDQPPSSFAPAAGRLPARGSLCFGCRLRPPPSPPNPNDSKSGSTLATAPSVAKMPAPGWRWRRWGCAGGCASALGYAPRGCALRFGVAPGTVPLPCPLLPDPEDALLIAGGTHAIVMRRGGNREVHATTIRAR